MKHLLYFLVATSAAYFLFVYSDQPTEVVSESQVASGLEAFAPKQASIALGLPVRRWMPASFAPTETAKPAENVVQVAQDYLETNRGGLGIQNYHALKFEHLDADHSIAHFAVYQDGYPIMGMNFRVQVGANGMVSEVKSDYRPIPEMDLSQPVLSPEELEATIAGQYESVNSNVPAVTVIYTPHSGDSTPVLAVAMTVKRVGVEDRPQQAIIRSKDGQVLDLTGPISF